MFKRIASTALATVLTVIATPATADDIPSKPALDVWIEAKELHGKRVSMSGCEIHAATFEFSLCGVSGPTGRMGAIMVQHKAMDREQLRDVLLNCAGFTSGPKCKVTVTGVIGTSILDQMQIEAESVVPES